MASIPELEGALASATIAEVPETAEEAALRVSRKHVLTFQQSEGEVKVNAPGYEHLLAKEDWTDLHLNPDLIKGILNENWKKPSKIQAQALTYIFQASRPNILAQSQNGSGKTGAFGLAMLSSVDATLAKPQAICLSPTRELAIQTTRRLAKLAQFMSPAPQVVTVIGGVEYKSAITGQVIIATPGKTYDLITRRILDVSHMKMFVLDEADDMIVNFFDKVSEIKKVITRGKKTPVQVLLFSASYECFRPTNPNCTRARDFSDNMLEVKGRGAPVSILIADMKDLRNENATHFVAKLPEARDAADAFKIKTKFLVDVYDMMTVGKTIIFCATRDKARAVGEALRAAGHKPSVITGDKSLSMEERTRIQVEFETGVTKVLITTDLYNRGIDIPGMKLVINFDLPTQHSKPGEPDYESFQHRCGRVGRFGTVGACLHLLTGGADAAVIDSIARHFLLYMHPLPENVLDTAVLVEKAMDAPLPIPGAPAPAPLPTSTATAAAVVPAAASGSGSGFVTAVPAWGDAPPTAT